MVPSTVYIFDNMINSCDHMAKKYKIRFESPNHFVQDWKQKKNTLFIHFHCLGWCIIYALLYKVYWLSNEAYSRFNLNHLSYV